MTDDPFLAEDVFMFPLADSVWCLSARDGADLGARESLPGRKQVLRADPRRLLFSSFRGLELREFPEGRFVGSVALEAGISIVRAVEARSGCLLWVEERGRNRFVVCQDLPSGRRLRIPADDLLGLGCRIAGDDLLTLRSSPDPVSGQHHVYLQSQAMSSARMNWQSTLSTSRYRPRSAQEPLVALGESIIASAILHDHDGLAVGFVAAVIRERSGAVTRHLSILDVGLENATVSSSREYVVVRSPYRVYVFCVGED